MNRRDLLKNGGLLGLGSLLLGPERVVASSNNNIFSKNKKAKNIIFLVSDGMSQGTLTMADMYLQRFQNRGSHWLDLYRNNQVNRGLMDMSSASSLVTDSAAASSSWGSGERVRNGVINVAKDGRNLKPIWKKMKDAGKKAGCVTTVPVTHATPAGFTANSERRNSQEDIALQLVDHRYDVMLGGGKKYFAPDLRSDGKDVITDFRNKGGLVVTNLVDLWACDKNIPLIGLFADDALPYSIDHQNNLAYEAIPTLAQMTQVAIDRMKDHREGFVLQVEGGKVDWAAHANDVAGLIHDQIAFDEAIKVAMDFAMKDKETLVIITTDHGNANPGLLYGSNADENFGRITKLLHSNDFILNSLDANHTPDDIKGKFWNAQGLTLSDEEAAKILGYYKGIEKEESGVYNYKNLPFHYLSEILTKHTSVGWISTDHTADFVELAMYGPGSDAMKSFMLNTNIHYLMLDVCGVKG